MAAVLVDSPAHGPFVPDFYQQCDAVHVPDNTEPQVSMINCAMTSEHLSSQCLLADLYFSISLEFTRQNFKEMDVSFLIGPIKSISQVSEPCRDCMRYGTMIVFQTLASETTSPLERAILAVENQVLIHILLENLACELHLDNEEISQVCQ